MYPLTYFSRHGETDWNAEGRLQGQADTPLNAKGRAQADGNGSKLAGLLELPPADLDYLASPLTRTRDTMERIRVGLSLPSSGYRLEPLLMELCFGDWETYTFEELESREPGVTASREAAKWTFVPPGTNAESYEMLSERVARWLESLMRPTVCVTHGGVIRSLFRLIGGVDAESASTLDVPQDKLLRLEGTQLTWH